MLHFVFTATVASYFGTELASLGTGILSFLAGIKYITIATKQQLYHFDNRDNYVLKSLSSLNVQ